MLTLDCLLTICTSTHVHAHFVGFQEVYKPQRKYQRRAGAEKLVDEESKVHATLLEYGRYIHFVKVCSREPRISWGHLKDSNNGRQKI